MDEPDPSPDGRPAAPVSPASSQVAAPAPPQPPVPAGSVRIAPARGRDLVFALATALAEGMSPRDAESLLLANPELRPHGDAIVVLCRCIEHGRPLPSDAPVLARTLVDVCTGARDGQSRLRGLRCLARFAMVARAAGAPPAVPQALPFFAGSLAVWFMAISLDTPSYRWESVSSIVWILLRTVSEALHRGTGPFFFLALAGSVGVYLLSDWRWITGLRRFGNAVLGVAVRARLRQFEEMASALTRWSAGLPLSSVSAPSSGWQADTFMLATLSPTKEPDHLIDVQTFRAVARVEQSRGRADLLLDLAQGAAAMVFVLFILVFVARPGW